MTEIKNETGTKKKLLIPVVVLMLLAVGLTGAAYAYSSSVSNTGNVVDADYLSIDLRTGTASDVEKVQNPGALVFTDNYTYTNLASKQDQVNADVTTAKLFQYKLKVSSDTNYNKLKVTSEDVSVLLAKQLNATNPTITVGQLFKIYVNTAGNMSGAKELQGAENTNAIFTITKDTETETTNFDVYVFLVALDGGVAQTNLGDTVKTSVRNTSDVAAENDHNAKYFQNLFSGNDYKFTIKFDAYYEA